MRGAGIILNNGGGRERSPGGNAPRDNPRTLVPLRRCCGSTSECLCAGRRGARAASGRRSSGPPGRSRAEPSGLLPDTPPHPPHAQTTPARTATPLVRETRAYVNPKHTDFLDTNMMNRRFFLFIFTPVFRCRTATHRELDCSQTG